MTLNCRGKLLDLSSPIVMGILNITPDSFHDGGKYLLVDDAIMQVENMVNAGAAIIDIGGMSSRPGAKISAPDEEINRVLPVICEALIRYPEIFISIDTIHAEVADTALKAGAHIVNDISAGRFSTNMLEIVAKHYAPFIIMHMQGMPDNMQQNPVYDDVVAEVYDFLAERIKACTEAGIKDIIIDPGFGFGKAVEHNYSLLRNLQYFTSLNQPILAGLSRKSMICKVLKVNPDKALNGTTASNMLALANGARILRVHDVKEATECIKIWQAYNGCF